MSSLTVSAVSTVSVDILHHDIQKVLQLKDPDITHCQLAKNESVNGVNYREGMVVVHGSAVFQSLHRLSRWLLWRRA